MPHLPPSPYRRITVILETDDRVDTYDFVAGTDEDGKPEKGVAVGFFEAEQIHTTHEELKRLVRLRLEVGPEARCQTTWSRSRPPAAS